MQNKYLYGIDLGGTKVEGSVLQLGDQLEVVFRDRILTERYKGYDHIVGQIVKVAEMMFDATGERPSSLGIGTPGNTDWKTGLLRNSNTIVLNGRTLHADLEEKLGMEVAMANDANCFALAEYHLGAVRDIEEDVRMMFGVIMGSGVGGGLVFDGQIWDGNQGIAGEWGHNFLDEIRRLVLLWKNRLH